MGLAASQARLISLQARMSDVEYEGQQINQQRQVLTNKMNDVYNQAMDMEVPTPPSKIDFAINDAYIGKGAANSKYNFEVNSDGSYTCYTYDEGNTYSQFSNFQLPKLTTTVKESHSLSAEVTFDSATQTEYKNENGDPISLSQRTIPPVYGEDENGNPTDEIVTPGSTVYYLPAGTTYYTTAEQGTGNDFGLYSEVLGRADQALKDKIEGAKAAFDSAGISISDLAVIIKNNGNGNYDISFCSNADLTGRTGDTVSTVYRATEGKIKNVISDHITPTIDSNGNPSSVTMPDGTVVKLQANGDAYDEIAYDSAYRQYELDKIQYDREQNEFNKQTSIYQRQDKQLELKLTRLDNERNALNTEIDAVKKVIQDAVEGGFKTFSG